MCPFSSLLLSYLFTGMGFVPIVMVMSCLLLSSATMEAKFSAPVGSKVMVMFVFIFGLNEVVHPLVPHDASNSNTFLFINLTYHYVAIAFFITQVMHFSSKKVTKVYLKGHMTLFAWFDVRYHYRWWFLT